MPHAPNVGPQTAARGARPTDPRTAPPHEQPAAFTVLACVHHKQEAPVNALALGGLQVPGTPAGFAAVVLTTIDGKEATLTLSRLDDETCWTCDGLSLDGVPQWMHGYGARRLRCRRLTHDGITDALNAIVAEQSQTQQQQAEIARLRRSGWIVTVHDRGADGSVVVEADRQHTRSYFYGRITGDGSLGIEADQDDVAEMLERERARTLLATSHRVAPTSQPAVVAMSCYDDGGVLAKR